jgi:hypothetical protein
MVELAGFMALDKFRLVWVVDFYSCCLVMLVAISEDPLQLSVADYLDDVIIMEIPRCSFKHFILSDLLPETRKHQLNIGFEQMPLIMLFVTVGGIAG